MPLRELLDPQGKAVNASLHNLGLNSVNAVRVGKHINLFIDAASQEQAETITRDACVKLLANQVMEYFEFTVTPEQ